jgi:hypothetical protein
MCRSVLCCLEAGAAGVTIRVQARRAQAQERVKAASSIDGQLSAAERTLRDQQALVQSLEQRLRDSRGAHCLRLGVLVHGAVACLYVPVYGLTEWGCGETVGSSLCAAGSAFLCVPSICAPVAPLHVAGISSQQARRALEAMFTSLRIAFPKGDGGEAPMRADEAFERVRCVPLHFVSSLCSSLAATCGFSPL